MTATVIGCQTSSIETKIEDKPQTKEAEKSTSGKSSDEQKSMETSEDAANIKIVNFSFDPAKHKIKKGDRLIWINKDSTTHTVTSDEKDFFDSGNLKQGKTYTQKFEKSGTVKYHCEIHPNMKAEITVE